MCEAVVYLVNGEEEKEVMRDVLLMEVRGERLRLTDFFGNNKELSARIKNINFSQHRVVVEEL